jgi:hypothetical protein
VAEPVLIAREEVVALLFRGSDIAKSLERIEALPKEEEDEDDGEVDEG